MATEMSSLTERMRGLLAPLTAEEQRRAVASALAVAEADGRSLHVHGVELALEKPDRRGAPPARRVRVRMSEPASIMIREVLVDGEGQVVSDVECGPRNLPYGEDEIDRAREVAERDERVAQRIAGCHVGVGTYALPLPESGHRLVGLHFVDISDAAIPQPLTSVGVDLATGEVVSVRQAGAGGHEREEV